MVYAPAHIPHLTKHTNTVGKAFSNIGHIIWHHKYFWTILLFIIIVGFVDTNSLWHRYQLHADNNSTRAEIEKYDRKYEAAETELNRLASSPEAVEIVAREHLMMKTADEDVYEIVEVAE